MVQNLPDNKSIYKNEDGTWKTPDEVGDNAVVDFAQILYYCDTSDTSVAGNAFGGGMFNNVHYFNAVKVNKLQGNSKSATMTTGEPNKNWYYVDVCYDDVNTECMAQTRVENAGDSAWPRPALRTQATCAMSTSWFLPPVWKAVTASTMITLTRCTMATPTPRTRIPMWMMTAMLC